ncbi:MAG: recombinase family protein, partial [Christensenellales bacterium]
KVCSSPTIKEEDLHRSIANAVNLAIDGKDEFVKTLKKNIKTALKDEICQSGEEISAKLLDLQKKLLVLVNTNADYGDVASEIHRLKEMEQNATAQTDVLKNERMRFVEMLEFIQRQSGEMEYSETLVRKLVGKVTVYEDMLVVLLKSGVEYRKIGWIE